MDVGCLHAVLLLELDVLLPEGVDSIDHALHELNLGVAETVLVGDVVGVACEGKSGVKLRTSQELKCTSTKKISSSTMQQILSTPRSVRLTLPWC